MKDVAAYIARGGGGDVEALAEDAALLGITIEGELDEHPACLVWPENMPAVRVFLGLITQWNWVAVSGLGGGAVFRTGLRLEALPVVANAYGVRVTPELMFDLRVLEAEYIELTTQ